MDRFGRDRAPFSFEKTEENSEFQIVEIYGGYEYKYGFEYNAECIVTEWMYRKNLETNRTVTILERTTNNVKFGASVKKECELYKEQIPSETLALSFFNKLKLRTDVFTSVYSAIMSTLVVPTNFCEDTDILEELLPQVIDRDKEKLVEFLSAIDTGIQDIFYDDSEKNMKFYTFHKGKDGEEYPLSLYFESEGTIKSIMLFIYARLAVLNGGSIFVIIGRYARYSPANRRYKRQVPESSVVANVRAVPNHNGLFSYLSGLHLKVPGHGWTGICSDKF